MKKKKEKNFLSNQQDADSVYSLKIKALNVLFKAYYMI